MHTVEWEYCLAARVSLLLQTMSHTCRARSQVSLLPCTEHPIINRAEWALSTSLSAFGLQEILCLNSEEWGRGEEERRHHKQFFLSNDCLYGAVLPNKFWQPPTCQNESIKTAGPRAHMSLTWCHSGPQLPFLRA